MCSQVGHMEATTWVSWRRGGWDTSRKQKCTGPGNAPSMIPSFLPVPQGRMSYQGVNKNGSVSTFMEVPKEVTRYPSESKMKPGQGRGPSRKSGSERQVMSKMGCGFRKRAGDNGVLLKRLGTAMAGQGRGEKGTTHSRALPPFL